MEIRKEQSSFGTDIVLEEPDKYLMMNYGGNLDLYWSIHDRDPENKTKTFTITKENYGVYQTFEQLFHDIETINIHDNEDDDEFLPFLFDSEEEKREYLREQRRRQEEEKKLYRECNKSHYNDLFHPEDQTITWYSDETAQKVANKVTIKKEKDTFELVFETQPHIEGYDRDFGNAYYIPIRFRNSGSSYNPFNILFMKMYNTLKDVDDVKDEGHQIHIEEVLYEQNKQLLKTKD